ncbi:MAG: hypothetical protein AUK34_10400 [Ignavibacteria bacterium CG2_30_36_16]|nr:MAG: hypothetical protein AUK34_10400 [Ignavibacteria bacterium CG2_30_36_16]PJB02408.1 MAG: High-affinity nickel transporter [Ignavibacteria bacterium CG_4_9_14_3_um_filter_36_18]
MISIIAGFAAGSIHVFAGPDHLAAVSPLAIQHNRSASRLGLQWGLGHTSGVILLGGIALIFREMFSLNAISGYSEKMVGVILIFIGLWGIKKAATKIIHAHTHDHNNIEHTHFHFHSKVHNEETQKSHNHFHAAFGVGIMHGLAGTSHIFGILPALAFNSQTDAALYLLFFGIGTIFSMVLFSSFLGFLSQKIELRGTEIYKKMLIGFSSVSLVIGVYWIFT